MMLRASYCFSPPATSAWLTMSSLTTYSTVSLYSTSLRKTSPIKSSYISSFEENYDGEQLVSFCKKGKQNCSIVTASPIVNPLTATVGCSSSLLGQTIYGELWYIFFWITVKFNSINVLYSERNRWSSSTSGKPQGAIDLSLDWVYSQKRKPTTIFPFCFTKI